MARYPGPLGSNYRFVLIWNALFLSMRAFAKPPFGLALIPAVPAFFGLLGDQDIPTTS